MTSWGDLMNEVFAQRRYPTLQTGEIVRVFSQSADQWVNGTITNTYIQDNTVQVEYKIGNRMLRERLNEDSLNIKRHLAASALHEDDDVRLQSEKRFGQAMVKRFESTMEKRFEQAMQKHSEMQFINVDNASANLVAKQCQKWNQRRQNQRSPTPECRDRPPQTMSDCYIAVLCT